LPLSPCKAKEGYFRNRELWIWENCWSSLQQNANPSLH
jgi:hypothetical protein